MTEKALVSAELYLGTTEVVQFSIEPLFRRVFNLNREKSVRSKYYVHVTGYLSNIHLRNSTLCIVHLFE